MDSRNTIINHLQGFMIAILPYFYKAFQQLFKVDMPYHVLGVVKRDIYQDNCIKVFDKF